MISRPHDFKIIFNFCLLFFVIIVPFVILHYPNIDSAYWLREDVQGIVE